MILNHLLPFKHPCPFQGKNVLVSKCCHCEGIKLHGKDDDIFVQIV